MNLSRISTVPTSSKFSLANFEDRIEISDAFVDRICFGTIDDITGFRISRRVCTSKLQSHRLSCANSLFSVVQQNGFRLSVTVLRCNSIEVVTSVNRTEHSLCVNGNSDRSRNILNRSVRSLVRSLTTTQLNRLVEVEVFVRFDVHLTKLSGDVVYRLTHSCAHNATSHTNDNTFRLVEEFHVVVEYDRGRNDTVDDTVSVVYNCLSSVLNQSVIQNRTVCVQYGRVSEVSVKHLFRSFTQQATCDIVDTSDVLCKYTVELFRNFCRVSVNHFLVKDSLKQDGLVFNFLGVQ